MEKSDTVDKLFAALAKAQGEFLPASKDNTNDFGRNYADLSAVINATRKSLSANGLSLMQFPGSDNDGVFVETMLAHESGQWVRSKLHVPSNDPQGTGTMISYARRYALQATLNVSAEDDDASGAQKKAKERKEMQRHIPQVPPIKEPEHEWKGVKMVNVEENKEGEKLWWWFDFSNNLSAFTTDHEVAKKVKALGDSPCDAKVSLAKGASKTEHRLLSITYIEQ